jgi:hypothetical protein
MAMNERRSLRGSRWRTAAVASIIGVAIAACGPNPVSTPSSSPAFSVNQFGAKGNGVFDNTAAFARAIASAQAAGGGTVNVPAGRYSFSSDNPPNRASIVIQGSAPVTLQGMGRTQTFLIEARPNKGLLGVVTDHTVVSNLTLDTQMHNGGAAIFVRANYTSLLHVSVLGGAHAFALYYAGPLNATPAAPTYDVGNRVYDLELNDLVCNDGFSWSFQKNSSISDVVHTGSRLALYVDDATTVTDYWYTPGTQQCDARDGFWVTPPADDITIVGFVSSGEGGEVGVNGAGVVGRIANNVTIRGLRLTGGDDQLLIGDVTNFLLEDSNLGDNAIVIAPQQIAEGSISNCTFGRIVHKGAAGALVAIKVAS